MDDNAIPGSATSGSTLTSPEPPRPGLRNGSALKNIFVGPNGLRAGWRLLIFIGIVCVLVVAVGIVVRLFGGNPRTGTVAQVTPLQLGELEGAILFYTAAAAWIMAKIEGRKFGRYGLPWNQALGKDF